MTDLIAIFLSLTLFIVLAFRGHDLLLSAIGCCCFMFLLSGQDPLEGLTEQFLPGLAGFIQDYLLLFLFSALLGRLMSDGGSAKRIALALAGLICRRQKARRFFSMLLVATLYFVLCYVGITGFVVIFTVLPIARDLFERTDTPWRFYCCGGAQSIAATFLVGSLQAGNVYAIDVCGTTLNASPLLSLVAFGTFQAVFLLLLRIAARDVDRSGEGFLPSGTGILAAEVDKGVAEDRLPSLPMSLLPAAVVLLLAAGFGLPVVPVLCLGCLLTVVTCWSNLRPILKSSLSKGVMSSTGPVLGVAATYAIGISIRSMEGYSFFEVLLSALPDLAQGCGLGLLSSFIMASAIAPIPAFGNQMLEHFTAAGLSAEASHRMMTVTAFTSIAPHNAGITNAATVLRLPYSKCLKMYLLFTYIPGVCTLLTSCLAIVLGIVK